VRSRLRRLLPHALRQWPLLGLIAGLTALSSGLAALQPWPAKIVVDYALAQAPPPEALLAAFGWLGIPLDPKPLILLAACGSFLLFACSSAMEAGLAWSWAVAGQRMMRDLVGQLFARLQRRSPGYHQQHTVADSLERLTTDSWCVYKLTDGLLIAPVQKCVTLAALGVVAWGLNRELAIYALVTAPLMAWASMRLGEPLKQRARALREARTRLVSFVHQTLTSIPVVQTFAAEDRHAGRFHKLAEDAVDVSQRGALLTGIYGLVTGLITVAGTALIIFVGGRQVLEGGLTLGSFLVFLAYLRTLQTAAEGLLKVYGALKPIEASVDRVLEVLEPAADEVHDHLKAEPLVAVAGSAPGHVRIEAVTFGYAPGAAVLREMTFEARPGETVALVGATGAGKSTLVALLLRFQDPWSGRITLGGRDIRLLRLAELRAQFAVVLQEALVFPITVADNIAYGRPEATREEVVAAARAARADGFIDRLPRGYDTTVSERGATLSGGERQRLGLARALLLRAPILILDEATSALDGETEAAILETLERGRGARTTLVVAHRLATVRRADRIVVLDGGRVAETGTHAELVAREGLYARYVRLQALDAHGAEAGL
jgi:ATP-binding cassette subfamily B protein/subfamily B ATP-binding cassette protein MsbA